MSNLDKPDGRRIMETLAGRAMLVLFGLGVLGFLVVIDRAEWFAIRPATGTSVAMSNASTGVTAPGFAAKAAEGRSTPQP